MHHDQRIGVVQILRGIAALGVLLWHTSVYLGPYGEGLGGALFKSASTMGVDLFFVLSGFIMAFTSQRTDHSFHFAASFWIRRFSRVWPVYAVATLLIFAMQFDNPSQTLGRLARSLLFVPKDPVPFSTPPTLNVGWTLNYEIYFYSIFSVSLMFGRFRWAAFAAYMGATLILLPWMFGTSGAILGGSRYLALITDPIMWLFVEGVVIGLLFCSPFRLTSEFWADSLALAATSLALLQYASQFRLEHGVTGAGLSMGFLVLALALSSKTIVIAQGRILEHLGRVSFSLYLLHPLVMHAYAVIAPKLVGKGYSGWTGVIFVSMASILAANIGHRFLEQGLSEWCRRRLLLAFDSRAGAGGLKKQPKDPSAARGRLLSLQDRSPKR